MEVNWGLIEVNCLAGACKCIEKPKKNIVGEVNCPRPAPPNIILNRKPRVQGECL